MCSKYQCVNARGQLSKGALTTHFGVAFNWRPPSSGRREIERSFRERILKYPKKNKNQKTVAQKCLAHFRGLVCADALADANAGQTKRSASASYAIHATLVIRNTS